MNDDGLMHELAQVLGRDFKRVENEADRAWAQWERKTLNSHRGVFYWRPTGTPPTAEQIEHAVRDHVKRTIRQSWWRGYAFGVVIDMPTLPEGLDACVDHIDARNNRRGVWQWSILLGRDIRFAVGVHTWMRVRLTPYYELLMAMLEAQGVEVTDCKKDKDRLLRVLTAISTVKLPEISAPSRGGITKG